jgi:hypothetical protein
MRRLTTSCGMVSIDGITPGSNQFICPGFILPAGGFFNIHEHLCLLDFSRPRVKKIKP